MTVISIPGEKIYSYIFWLLPLNHGFSMLETEKINTFFWLDLLKMFQVS